ncbi:hypothetical protein AMTR_s01449p00007930, partial [Amborella trichopoda]
MALAAFELALDTSWHAVLVVPSSNHQPIRIRQPRVVLTFDMSVRACHVDEYKPTHQPIISAASA